MSMIIDGTNGLTFNNATTQASAGVVLQVVSTSLTSTLSVSGSAFTDVTGLSVSITPKFSTSKILITGTLNATSGDISYFQIVRNSTAIGIGDAASSRIRCTGGGYGTGSNTTWMPAALAFNYLDSPATISATTYKIQIGANSGITTYVNRGANDSDSGNAGRSISTITVMEIAA
jgi:hypothetical protein